MQNQIKALVNELFEKLNIKIDLIEVEIEEDLNIFNIKVKTEESWLLIGHNWKNIDAIQNILKLIISRKTWEKLNSNETTTHKIKLNLKINDYTKTKDDRLFDFIQKEILYLERTWKDIKLPFYSSYERKKIHSIVHKMANKLIFTKSVWEGKERRLYICKQKPKLTIDIDWDDI